MPIATKDQKKLPLAWLFRGAQPLSDKQTRILNIFFYTTIVSTACAMLGIILYYIYAYAALYRGSDSFNWVLSVFADFVSIMNAALADSPYVLEDGASYPPIAIMVLYPFALICKGVFATYAGQEWISIEELTSQVILHPQFWVALVLFFLVSTASIILIVIKKYQLEPVAAFKVSMIILLSAPFVYAIMRGNTIYFALIFLLLFLLLYENPRPWVREIAYLCLVIAGSIKIYPLFFGVFLLKKKKFFASFRVAVYFFTLFFLSFHFFSGGLKGMEPFFENLTGFMSSDNRLLSLRNLSVPALLYKVIYLFSPAATETVFFSVLSLCVMLFMFFGTTLTATVTKSHHSRSVLASGIVILLPTISYFYTLVFMVIPFMEFLRAYNTLPKWKQRLYVALYIFLFLTFAVLPQCFVPHTLAVITMMAVEGWTVLQGEIIPWLRGTKDRRAQKRLARAN